MRKVLFVTGIIEGVWPVISLTFRKVFTLMLSSFPMTEDAKMDEGMIMEANAISHGPHGQGGGRVKGPSAIRDIFTKHMSGCGWRRIKAGMILSSREAA